MTSTGRRQRGATLVELVMAIVIISGAVGGVLTVIGVTTARSANPVLNAQAQAVARAYLEEILAQSFADPDGSEAGEVRATFDDVDDYHGLVANGCTSASAACPGLGDCVCDQTGAPIDALDRYAVAVTVVATTLGALPAARVDVLVTHAVDPEVRIAFSGYRTSY